MEQGTLTKSTTSPEIIKGVAIDIANFLHENKEDSIMLCSAGHYMRINSNQMQAILQAAVNNL